MNRTALCIQMLQLLNSHKRMSVNELASILETNPRNIIEFKKELECAGYTINAFTGKYGGYELDKTKIIPSVNLTEEEKTAISSGIEYLRARNDFVNINEFNIAISKLLTSYKKNNIYNIDIYYHFPLSMDFSEIEYRFNIISSAIENRRTIILRYASLESVTSNKTVNPYKLFMYNNAWFMLAYDINKDKVSYYKLNRIIDIEETKNNFRIPLTYNEKNYLNKFGMKNNGEWFSVQLQFLGKNARLIPERIYGKNQTIESLPNDNIILKVEMQNKDDIISFVRSFGKDCKVITPKWLKEALK